jgi:hypothetical protein
MILKKLDAALKKHNIITPLKILNIAPEEIDRDRRLINSAVKFDFVGYDIEHLNLVSGEAGVVWNEGVLGMPAGTTYFEHDWIEPTYGAVKSCHIVCHMDAADWHNSIELSRSHFNLDDKSDWDQFVASEDGLWLSTYLYIKVAKVFMGIPYRFMIARAPGTEKRLVVPLPKTDKAIDIDDGYYKAAMEGWLNISANQPVALAYTLNIKGVTWETKSSPGFRRKSSNRKPRFEHKVVTVRPGSVTTTSASSNDNEDARQSPRFHLRRGHIRRTSYGKIWIKPMWVGDKDKGIITHDYNVRNEPWTSSSL